MKTMMSVTLLLMTTLLLAADKKFYKYTDEQGVTHYSETKLNDQYEEADLPQLSVVPSAPVNETSQSASTVDATEVDPSEVVELTLIEPTSEQNLWGTGGKLTAKVNPLSEAQLSIHHIQFIIDGKKQPPANQSTQVFDGIYRGEHTVQAQLVNKYTQKVIKESETITFFMHQNSKK